jgi:hypothetical protein
MTTTHPSIKLGWDSPDRCGFLSLSGYTVVVEKKRRFDLMSYCSSPSLLEQILVGLPVARG